jgi:hypothetical protein
MTRRHRLSSRCCFEAAFTTPHLPGHRGEAGVRLKRHKADSVSCRGSVCRKLPPACTPSGVSTAATAALTLLDAVETRSDQVAASDTAARPRRVGPWICVKWFEPRVTHCRKRRLLGNPERQAGAPLAAREAAGVARLHRAECRGHFSSAGSAPTSPRSACPRIGHERFETSSSHHICRVVLRHGTAGAVLARARSGANRVKAWPDLSAARQAVASPRLVTSSKLIHRSCASAEHLPCGGLVAGSKGARRSSAAAVDTAPLARTDPGEARCHDLTARKAAASPSSSSARIGIKRFQPCSCHLPNCLRRGDRPAHGGNPRAPRAPNVRRTRHEPSRRHRSTHSCREAMRVRSPPPTLGGSPPACDRTQSRGHISVTGGGLRSR